MTGYTHSLDSFPGYLQAFIRSGANHSGAARVLSNRTAYVWTMCAKDMNQFYENLLQVVLQDENSASRFEASKKNVEHLLGINLKDDFISWMDGEVCFAQNKKFKDPQKDEYIALFRLKDRDLAANRLNFLNSQIKKRATLTN